MRLAPDRLVLVVHLVPGEASRRGGATVVLVEGPLAEQHDQLDASSPQARRYRSWLTSPPPGSANRSSRPPSSSHTSAGMNRLLLSPIGPNSPRPDDPAGVLISKSR